MRPNKQEQETGEKSVAIQSGHDTHYHAGTNEARAYEIAEHVVSGYLERFERTAYLVAASRVDQLRIELIDRIKEFEPERLRAFEDPDVQMVVLEAQKGYARSGIDEQRGTLIDLVATRCGVETGSLQALAINGAVETVTKLPRKAIDTLTAHWLASRVKSVQMVDRSLLHDWAETNLAPFVPNLSQSATIYEMLEAAGCGSISVLGVDLRENIGKEYLGIFQRNFALNEISDAIQQYHSPEHPIYIPARYPPEEGKFQMAFTDAKVAEDALRAKGAPESEISQFTAAMTARVLPSEEVEEILRNSHAAWGIVLDEWKMREASNFRISTVGSVIAHCRFTHETGDLSDLSIWVAEI